MERLIEQAQKGDMIVVMRRTRLADDPIIVGQLDEAFAKKGIELAVLDPRPTVYKVADGDGGGNG